MSSTDLLPVPDLDELATLELAVARRADELSREAAGRSAARDFWREAEMEIWGERVARWWRPEPACA